MPQNTPRGYTYPLYTDPVNFPAQIQDLALDIDADMQNLYTRVAAGYVKPACSVRTNGVNQAVANNTDVTATYTEELYDNASMVNLGVSNTTVTFTEAGVYIAQGRVTFLSNGNGGGLQLAISTTGPMGIVGRRSMPNNTAVSTAVALTVLFYAEVGNTLTMVQRQNTGASLNTSTRQLQIAKVSVV